MHEIWLVTTYSLIPVPNRDTMQTPHRLLHADATRSADRRDEVPHLGFHATYCIICVKTGTWFQGFRIEDIKFTIRGARDAGPSKHTET